MNSFVDEVLTGDPKYTLTYNDNTQATNVAITLSTPVQTQGTALNKAFFDSIQTDFTNLNTNKLNVSAKATTSQAQSGTNDTNYVTPLKVKQREQALTTTKTITATGSATSQTLYDFSTATGNIVEISGQFICSNSVTSGPEININGTNISGKTSNGYSVITFHCPRGKTSGFYLRFDLANKSYTGSFEEIGNPASTTSTSGSFDTFVAHYGTLSNISAILRGTSGQSSIQATIKQNY